MKLLAISGSLRKDSLNTKLARAAAAAAPAGVHMDVVTLHGIPLYDEDLRTRGTSAEVLAFAKRVADSSGILIVTPEYNFSIPGVLKNALDWASRLDPLPFAGKPTAIMSASMGALGGARVQYHLRQVLLALDAAVLNRPEVFLGAAHNKFDDNGNLNDSVAKDLVTKLVHALAGAGEIRQ